MTGNADPFAPPLSPPPPLFPPLSNQVVYDELLSLMGSETAPLVIGNAKPTIILMAGLQGVGKTTACGKLALYLKVGEG